MNSTYRDWDEQMRLHLAYLRDPKNNPLALHPDRSMHCKGLAIDSDDHTLMRSMTGYGWRATVSSEPWHFDYFRALDNHHGEPAGGDSKPLPTPTPPQEEEDDMAFVYRQYVSDKRDPAGRYKRALVCLEAHVFVRFVESGSVQAVKFKQEYDTGDSIGVTDSMLNALEAEVRRGQPRDDVSVLVGDADG